MSAKTWLSPVHRDVWVVEKKEGTFYKVSTVCFQAIGWKRIHALLIETTLHCSSLHWPDQLLPHPSKVNLLCQTVLIGPTALNCPLCENLPELALARAVGRVVRLFLHK